MKRNVPLEVHIYDEKPPIGHLFSMKSAPIFLYGSLNLILSNCRFIGN